jgi:hypothetical protein
MNYMCTHSPNVVLECLTLLFLIGWGGPGLKCRPEDRLSWPRFMVVFLSSKGKKKLKRRPAHLVTLANSMGADRTEMRNPYRHLSSPCFYDMKLVAIIREASWRSPKRVSQCCNIYRVSLKTLYSWEIDNKEGLAAFGFCWETDRFCFMALPSRGHILQRVFLNRRFSLAKMSLKTHFIILRTPSWS